jgi:short-subunit dehydrogenase
VRSGCEGEGRHVLVTGASAGIGRALARVFARHGFNLVLTARRVDRLNALKTELEDHYGVRAYALPGDLANPDTPGAIFESLAQMGIHIDGLVNNAGYNLRSTVPDRYWQEKNDLLQVMAIAPYALTHLSLPGMRQRGYGRILNVASVVGLLPGAVSNSFYAGVKAMQVSFSEALHAGEKPHGVHVTALCPGLTYSEFHDVDGTREELARLPKFLWHTSESVAEAGYKALSRNDLICVPGLFYKSAILGARIIPRRLANGIVSRRVGRARRENR